MRAVHGAVHRSALWKRGAQRSEGRLPMRAWAPALTVSRCRVLRASVCSALVVAAAFSRVFVFPSEQLPTAEARPARTERL